MACKKCVMCGLVIDNHDYQMALNCISGIIPTHYESMIKALHNWRVTLRGKRNT